MRELIGNSPRELRGIIERLALVGRVPLRDQPFHAYVFADPVGVLHTFFSPLPEVHVVRGPKVTGQPSDVSANSVSRGWPPAHGRTGWTREDGPESRENG